MREKKETIGKGLVVALIVFGFLAAAFFITMASTLNPWSEKLPHLDSAVWLRCAVEMKQGKTMYVDVWDHKGPVLFAIQYLGLTLTPHSLTGIWILEWISVFLLLWAFYLTAGLISENKGLRFLAAVLSLHPFYYFYQQGNCVEEWALPLIAFSLYFFLKYLKTERMIRREILLAGSFMGLSFLLNGNLVAVWVCFVPVIAVRMIWQKKWKELGQCALFFGGGFLAVLAAVFLILGMQGALGAFLEAYVGFNSSYVSEVTLRSFISAVLNFAYWDEWFGYVHVALLFLLVHRREADWKWSGFLYSAVSLILINISGRGYEHYGLQLVPCMILPMAVCVDGVYRWCRDRREFLFVLAVISMAWLRFEVAHYQELASWTLTEEGDNSYAGGKVENYTIVNEWLNGKWSDEAIEKWVVNDTW